MIHSQNLQQLHLAAYIDSVYVQQEYIATPYHHLEKSSLSENADKKKMEGKP